MRTLILVNVVGRGDRHSPEQLGLRYMTIEGDYRWLDGCKHQETKFDDPRYKGMEELLYRKGRPGEPFRVLIKELQRVTTFPDFDRTTFIIHCEVWA